MADKMYVNELEKCGGAVDSPQIDDNDGLKHIDLENHHAAKGDDSDGKVDWNFKTLLAACGLCALYTGSQIPLYFVGACLEFIARDLGAVTNSSWLPVANTLAIAAVAPACGYLEDIFGRRLITLVGGLLISVGCIIMATAHTFGQGVVAMAIAGAGASIGELSALSGLSEIVPVKWRGYSAAALTIFVVPFDPYVMWSQLLSTHSTWRWTLWLSLIYNAVFTLILAFSYFPIAHPRAEGLSRRTILQQIDYVGCFLSIVGFTTFLVALQAGGYSHPWTSAYVLCLLLFGIALIVSFIIWEWRGAKYPMVPGELFTGQRIVALAYTIAFVSGMNFYSLLNFFPLTYTTVYVPDPVQIGLKGLAWGFPTTTGAVFIGAMLSIWKGHNRELLLLATVIMTTFGGALAALNPTNPDLAFAFSALAGFGVGGVVVPSATVAMMVVPDALLATTAALSLTIRAIGGSIGYSIYYNIFSNKLKKNLPAYIVQFAIGAGLPVGNATSFVTEYLLDPGQISSFPGITTDILEAAAIGSRWAYADSLKYVWYTSIPFGVTAIFCCALLPSTRKYMTNRIAVQVQH